MPKKCNWFHHFATPPLLTLALVLGHVGAFAQSQNEAGKASSANPATTPTAPSGQNLDTSLEPKEVSTSEISRFFRDMIVVQRRAKQKAGHYLLYNYGSFDFSDGPTTLYGLNLNLGYAFSNTFEAYVNFVPFFVSQERDINRQIRDLNFVDGKKAEIKYSKPKYQAMVEVLWAPAYGKDSWSPFSIVRSDTFFKFGGGAIFFEDGQGYRFNATVGKTFFLSPLFNVRFSAGGSYLQHIIEEEKLGFFVGILELGLIWYL